LNLQKEKGLGDTWSTMRTQIMQFSRSQSQSSYNFEMLRMLNPVTGTTDTLQSAPTILPEGVMPPSLRRSRMMGRLQAPSGKN
jgi:hypothetical protein